VEDIRKQCSFSQDGPFRAQCNIMIQINVIIFLTTLSVSGHSDRQMQVLDINILCPTYFQRLCLPSSRFTSS